MIWRAPANNAFPLDVCVWGAVVGRTPLFLFVCDKPVAALHGLFSLRPTLTVALHRQQNPGFATRKTTAAPFQFSGLLVRGCCIAIAGLALLYRIQKVIRKI